MSLSEQEVLTLAPDEGSAKAGKELAKPDKWLTLAFSEKAVWGEIRGSGSNPYRTQVDRTNIAFKCSCPSRKFPCKHGIGLLLIHANYPEKFSSTDDPDWVLDWLNKREGKSEKSTESNKSEPKDPKAAEKRKENREKKVASGIEEILLWEKDIIRNGMVGIPEKSRIFWKDPAARMVDAQAGGLSAMLRQLDDISYTSGSWKDELLESLAKIYISCKGYQNIKDLPELVQEDVKTAIGFTKTQDELRQRESVEDHWLVLGRQIEEEDGIIKQSNWLYGSRTLKFALILNFNHRSQPLIQPLIPGTAIDAELVFYPSNSPLRAIIKEQKGLTEFKKPTPKESFSVIESVYAEVISLNPWINQLPFIVKEIIPVKQSGKWVLKDNQGKYVFLTAGFSKIYELLAISGGKPLDISFLYQNNHVLPMAVWQNNKYITI